MLDVFNFDKLMIPFAVKQKTNESKSKPKLKMKSGLSTECNRFA